MARKSKKVETPPLSERVRLVSEARDALDSAQFPSDEALAVLLPLLDTLCKSGLQAIDQLDHVRESMRNAPINAVLRDLLLFDLLRWPLEPSEDVREKILADAKQSVRGRPLDAPRSQQLPGGTRIGGKDYGVSEGSPFTDVL